MYLTLYVVALAALAVHAPDVIWQPGAREFFVIVGALGVWRYSWGTVHFVRSLIYRHRSFPKLRREASRSGQEALPSHVYILVSSFRIRAETTVRVYQAAIAEAIRYGRPVTIVSSLVELADQRLIKHLFLRMAPPPEVRLMFVRRPAIGKRHSMACSLRAVCRSRPPADAAVMVLDGDTLLQPGCLSRSLPFLQLMPEVGGDHHGRGLRGRERPDPARLASPAVCPAASADVVDGAVGAPPGADRPHVDPAR